MASAIESQRLISLSLGKIAQSRSQKGGINLHKNLLVASVLHKARTACMLEYHTLQRQRQLEMQQRQQQQQQLEFEQQQEQARSAALSHAAFNTLQTPPSPSAQETPSHDSIPTCVREMEAEVQEMCESDLGHAIVPDLGQQEMEETLDNHDKENSPPVSEASDECSDLHEDLEMDAPAQVVPEAAASGPLQHLAAATQLAQDAASGATTTAAPTCNVLKRQRDDNSTPHDYQVSPPASKKARLVACRRESRDSSSLLGSNNTSNAAAASSCDSNQISNLVSIFNSGFSGLCAVSAAAGSEVSTNYTSTHLDNAGACQSDSQHSMGVCYARESAASQLSCSSSLGRLDSLPSAIGLVLTV